MLSPISLKLIQTALKEDIGSGDITTKSLIADDRAASARLLAKENMIVSGNKVVETVFRQVDDELSYRTLIADGSQAVAGEIIGEVEGRLTSILQAERTALNFIQHMSGISSLTRQVVDRVEGTGVKILDTRKTTPGFRELEKYAVLMGGGVNHRKGLYDQVLIKNNHIDALGGDVTEAVITARERVPEHTIIEVEIRNIDELTKAVRGRPDVLLLDNLSPQQIVSALIVLRTMDPAGVILTEASGGITLDNVRDYAETGVNSISLGLLTHSARAADISLRIANEDS